MKKIKHSYREPISSFKNFQNFSREVERGDEICGHICGKNRNQKYRTRWRDNAHQKVPSSGIFVEKENGCKQRFCSKILLWIFACFALSLLSLMVIFVVWTLVSYHNAITSLDGRVVQLEAFHKDYQHIMEQELNRRLDILLKQVSVFYSKPMAYRQRHR